MTHTNTFYLMMTFWTSNLQRTLVFPGL